MKSPIFIVVIFIWAATVSGAVAQMSVTSITPNAPGLGEVASAAMGNTVFTVAAASGVITKASGAGARVSGGSSLVTVTVSCAQQGYCDRKNANIRIGNIGTPTGRLGALGNFTVAMGSAVLVGGVSGTNPISFTIAPIGKRSSVTFFLGMDVPVAGDESGKPTGRASSAFYVYIAPQQQTPSNGLIGTATATVFRPITVSKSSDLNFGTVVRPASGNATVVIDPVTGQRAITGGGANVAGGGAGRAVYSISGEGGQAFSIALPVSFSMVHGSQNLTVNTTATASGAQILGLSLGAPASFGLGVGGSMTISSATATGTYSGSFNLTVSYD